MLQKIDDIFSFAINEAAAKKFMVESNAIEGEVGATENCEQVCIMAMIIGARGTLKESDILLWHKRLSEGRNMKDKGKYRSMQVVVGSHFPPPPEDVPTEMKKFFQELPELSPYRAYCIFEHIHPFEDLNGGIGRLIWLYVMLREKKNPFSLPFLNFFHYQALDDFRRI